MSPEKLKMLASIVSRIGKGALATIVFFVLSVAIAIAIETGVIFLIILFLAVSFLVGVTIERFFED